MKTIHGMINAALLSALFWVFLAWAFSSDAQAGYFLEVGIGKNGLAQDYWEGRDSTGAFFAAGYIHRIDMNQQIIGQWSHESQWTRGDGFDDRDETTNDSLSVRYRYEWR